MALNTFSTQGRLARDINIYNEDDDKRAVALMTIAVTRNYKTTGENGEEYRPADFLECKAFGKTAQFLNKFFKKGDVIVISNAEIRKGDNYEKDGETVYGQMYIHLNPGSVMFSEQNRNQEGNDGGNQAPRTPSPAPNVANNPLAAAMQNQNKAVI